MFDKILVVCVGNICRSPTGEYLLKTLLPNKTIASAGVGALIGKPADKTALKIAKEHGVNMGQHVAQQLTSELCREFDLMLGMEPGQINAVANIAPEARGKTMLMSHWYNGQDIPDPFRQSREAFEFAYELIELSAELWQKKIV